jgi:polyphosphate kinase
VLEEALDDRNPLLERLKFLSIFSSNLDEFFMIRVSGLKEELEDSNMSFADGLTPQNSWRKHANASCADQRAGALLARRDPAATEGRQASR